ncbi:PilN domain-containing protein [Rhizobium sp.]|uniref:PilN domain-containing protein n=1 Tax=Rhizobium sp. TaxID=391 RepID=UPI002897309D
MAEAAALENTPFDLDTVHVVPIQNSDNRVSALVIKRSNLANFLNEALSATAKPEALGIDQKGLTIWLPRRALETLHPIFSHLRRRRQWLATALAVLLIAIAATYTNLYLRYSAAEEKITASVEAQRDEALEVRILLDQQQKNLAAVEAARTGKNQAVPVVRIWEEVTRTIPDDAWITDLSFDGDTITLSGYAARSSGLIGDIASSPIFKDPSFVSPVVRVPGQSGERFELRAKVSQP